MTLLHFRSRKRAHAAGIALATSAFALAASPAAQACSTCKCGDYTITLFAFGNVPMHGRCAAPQ